VLYAIKDRVTDYVGFLAEIIKADIEVVDAELRKLAGVGVCGLNERLIAGGALYRAAFETGRYVFIENPRRHQVCERCEERGRCLEQMELAAPITIKDSVIGAVGLICSTREQKEQILGNARAYMFMINTISGYIADKAADAYEIRRLKEFAGHGEIRRIEYLEREEIRRALSVYGYDTAGKKKAADALGIGIATLYRKLEQYGGQMHVVV
jgi:transcriptional regulator with PAS, ATPase and Fis domain